MPRSANHSAVYLEIGKDKTFAGALYWPGWCRGGRNEQAALQALFEYGPRYGRVLQAAGIEFSPPDDAAVFEVVERIKGDSTTDFGAPGGAPAADNEPLVGDELGRYQAILAACWQALDAAAAVAADKELRKGPRGGGRDLDGVLGHVQGAEAGYLSSLGGRAPQQADLRAALTTTRQAVLDTLPRAANGEVAAQGPRGGRRWTPRYFVRRAAWHVLDHVWEIEDRASGSYTASAKE